MGAMPTHEAAAGVSRTLSLTAYNPDTGEAWTGRWESGDTLAATVWPGDDQAATFTPSAAWATATSGTFTVQWSGSSTSTVTPGRYRLRVTATDVSDSSRVFVIHEAWLVLTASPGAATAAKVYTTYDEVLALAPEWVDSLQAGKDQAGFREQRAKARKWTDGVVQAHYRRDNVLSRQNSLDHLLYGPGIRYPVHDAQLQTWLDDDRLVLTTPAGERIKSANAYYTLHLICEGQVGRDGDDTFRRLSARYRSMAGNELSQCTAEIDTTTVKDGVGDLFVDLSVVDRIRS